MMDYYKEVWVVIAICWFLVSVTGFVFLYKLPGREEGQYPDLRKLSTIIMGIFFVLYFATRGWDWFTDLYYEPAGNPFQDLFMALPLWGRRILWDFQSLLKVHYELFWIAVALRIFAKRGE